MEPMQISTSSHNSENIKEALCAYVSNYKGHTRLQRLLILADKQPKLKLDALQLCMELAKADKKIG